MLPEVKALIEERKAGTVWPYLSFQIESNVFDADAGAAWICDLTVYHNGQALFRIDEADSYPDNGEARKMYTISLIRPALFREKRMVLVHVHSDKAWHEASRGKIWKAQLSHAMLQCIKLVMSDEPDIDWTFEERVVRAGVILENA